MMEYIDGQNFMVKAHIDVLELETERYPEDFRRPKIEEIEKMRTMTDYQVMYFLEKNYRFGFDNFLSDWGVPVQE